MDQELQNVQTSEDIYDIAPNKVPEVVGGTLLASPGIGQVGVAPYGTGESNIAQNMQSSNFKSGQTGWRLGSNGIIEAVGVVISGAVVPDSTVTVPQGGTGAVTLTGILKGNGTSAFTAITPLAGTKIYYVSDTSGGAVTRKLTFVDGVLTAEV